MENTFITMLPDYKSSTKRNCRNYLHEEINQSEFLQVIKNPPCELYLEVDNLLSSPSELTKHKLKPPRSQNSYILYRRNESKRRNQLGLPNDLKRASKEISEMWRNEPPRIKNFFRILAAEGDRRHRLKFPDYKFDPIRKNSRFKVKYNRENFEVNNKSKYQKNALINQSQSNIVFVNEIIKHDDL
ncbi:hypothetical protein C1646_752508 [Rhizophagus diaphanus]|nr:hypothetical protein C1646_752508 [Rhizophagus diaphanus] [Rhizophagus sp. MUCL 43196]